MIKEAEVSISTQWRIDIPVIFSVSLSIENTGMFTPWHNFIHFLARLLHRLTHLPIWICAKQKGPKKRKSLLNEIYAWKDTHYFFSFVISVSHSTYSRYSARDKYLRVPHTFYFVLWTLLCVSNKNESYL